MGRNKELNQKTKDERREQILSAALRLFATRGLAATKITDIAAAAEMSQGLLYHYYRSKEDIFVELIRTAFERMNTAALELEKSPLPAREKIRVAIETLLRGLDDNEDTGLYYLLIAMATASEAIPEEAKAIIQSENLVPYEIIVRIITEGQKDGSLKAYDAGELALVFWTSIKGLAIHKAAHGAKFRTPSPEIFISMFMER